MLFSGGIAASETAADSTQGDTSGAAAAAENGELLYTFRTRFGTFGMCLLDVVVVASEPRVSAEQTRLQDLFDDEDDLGEDDIDL